MSFENFTLCVQSFPNGFEF